MHRRYGRAGTSYAGERRARAVASPYGGGRQVWGEPTPASRGRRNPVARGVKIGNDTRPAGPATRANQRERTANHQEVPQSAAVRHGGEPLRHPRGRPRAGAAEDPVPGPRRAYRAGHHPKHPSPDHHGERSRRRAHIQHTGTRENHPVLRRFPPGDDDDLSGTDPEPVH